MPLLGILIFLVPIFYFLYILATTIKNLINKLFINPKKKIQLLRNLRIDCNELDKIIVLHSIILKKVQNQKNNLDIYHNLLKIKYGTEMEVSVFNAVQIRNQSLTTSYHTLRVGQIHIEKFNYCANLVIVKKVQKLDD